MEYQKRISLPGNTANQPSKFKTKNWVEIIDWSYRAYRTGSPIKFETSMIKSSLCCYSDVYILVKGTIAVTKTGRAVAPNNINKKVIFKNCARFTDCIREINNNAKDIDVIMSIV